MFATYQLQIYSIISIAYCYARIWWGEGSNKTYYLTLLSLGTYITLIIDQRKFVNNAINILLF